jgi:hypothetical protein
MTRDLAAIEKLALPRMYQRPTNQGNCTWEIMAHTIFFDAAFGNRVPRGSTLAAGVRYVIQGYFRTG